MKSILFAGAALAAVFAATGAQAATDGWYGAVDIGYNFPFKMSATGGSNNAKFGLSSNGLADVRVGYKFNSNWRVEGEVGYRNNPLHSVSISNVTTPILVGGNVSAPVGLINAIYDFDQWNLNEAGRITPFVGAGVSMAVKDRSGRRDDLA